MLTDRVIPLDELVEWTLFVEGPLNHQSLVEALSANPDWGQQISKSGHVEVRVRQTISAASESGRIIFEQASGKWLTLYPPVNAYPVAQHPVSDAQPWIDLGAGRESVYCLYSSSERYRLAVNGGKRWPIKIGRTRRSLHHRLSEVQSGMRDALIVGLRMRSNSSNDLEAYLHRSLTHSRVESNARAREWFWSNLDEIQAIYKESVLH